MCLTIYFLSFTLLLHRRRTGLTNLWLPGALLIATATYAVNYSASLEALTLFGSAVMGQGTGVIASIWQKSEDEHHYHWRVLVLNCVAVLCAVASIWSEDSLTLITYHGRLRWEGLWDNPNVFGLLMGAGLVLVLGLEIRGLRVEDRKWKRIVGGLPCFLVVFFLSRGLFHSFSRGAWAAAACGVGYLMIQMKGAGAQVNQDRKSETENGDAHLTLAISPRPPGGKGESLSYSSCFSWFKRNWTPGFVVLISVLILSVWHFRKTEWHPARRALSVANANDFSWRNRVAAWEGTLQMMAEKPWLGLGWNQPEPMYEHYYLSPRLTESAAIQMNDYFMLGATLGIPALFCFGMYIWLSLREVPNSKLQVPDHHPGARPPRALFFVPSRKTSAAQEDSETIGLSHTSEVECEAHSTAPGAGALPGTLSSIHNPLSSSAWLQTTCRAGAIVLLVGFWFDGGLFKLPTASTFWILLELGRVDGVKA
ncbi:MAG TPA: O-antigen ligase family protein [Verrucomicrobiae bacterium]|nr:O-antigen ligase family protein [Verrucomicrobiae bacterium]